MQPPWPASLAPTAWRLRVTHTHELDARYGRCRRDVADLVRPNDGVVHVDLTRVVLHVGVGQVHQGACDCEAVEVDLGTWSRWHDVR